MTAKRRALRTAATTAALFAIYVGVGRLGLMLDAVGGFATLVWAPTGISLAALLLLGYRLVPGVFLGALVVNLWTGAPLAVALGIAVGNALEALLGAWAMRRFAGFQGSFDRLRDVVGLIVAAALISTLVSATIGVTSLTLGGIVSPHHFLGTWRAWWIGDALGDLVVAPFLLTWASVRDFHVGRGRVVEAIALGVTLTLATLGAFFLQIGIAPSALFPLFIWAAVRFELRGATTATALVSVLAIWGTLRGPGPFPGATLAERLLMLQTFMGGAALTPLVVGGAVLDRARAIRIRETFAAIVSHDLKNPLGAIHASAALLVRMLPDVSARRIGEHEQLVRRNVERMLRLIGGMLDAAAIHAGRMSIEVREENVRELITEAADLLRPLATAKNLDLRLEAVPPLHIMCDRVRVLQVLSNLIGNAVKFSHQGGVISLGVERLPRAARFWVRDHGVGIGADELRHVFERYWHASRTAGGATGLGLFVAKGIVEAHGGQLWAESRLGEGSTFSFVLPLRAEPWSRGLLGSTSSPEPVIGA